MNQCSVILLLRYKSNLRLFWAYCYQSITLFKRFFTDTHACNWKIYLADIFIFTWTQLHPKIPREWLQFHLSDPNWPTNYKYVIKKVYRSWSQTWLSSMTRRFALLTLLAVYERDIARLRAAAVNKDKTCNISRSLERSLEDKRRL